MAGKKNSNRKSETIDRAAFLEKVDSLIPWNRWLNFTAAKLSRSDIKIPEESINVLLRIYVLKDLYQIPDDNVDFIEYEVSESSAFHKFALEKSGSVFPELDMLRRFFFFMRTSGCGKVLMADFDSIIEEAGLKLRRGYPRMVSYFPKDHKA